MLHIFRGCRPSVKIPSPSAKAIYIHLSLLDIFNSSTHTHTYTPSLSLSLSFGEILYTLLPSEPVCLCHAQNFTIASIADRLGLTSPIQG